MENYFSYITHFHCLHKHFQCKKWVYLCRIIPQLRLLQVPPFIVLKYYILPILMLNNSLNFFYKNNEIVTFFSCINEIIITLWYNIFIVNIISLRLNYTVI